MDFFEKEPIPNECQQEQPLAHPCSMFSCSPASIDDLFSAQNTEEDLNLEWLSVYVEDCFSNQGSCFPAPAHVNAPLHATATTSCCKQDSKGPLRKSQDSSNPLQNSAVPGKGRTRSKRKRVTTPKINSSLFGTWSNSPLRNQPLHVTRSDPPLLKQAYWLADSELIINDKGSEDVAARDEELSTREVEVAGEVGMSVIMSSDKEGVVSGSGLGSSSSVVGSSGQQAMPRRCSHCLSQKTPQWRTGPLGPKTLCNACGVRYKSGRLLPEYRPAKSPTFVSCLHSNSHKKVMEMRMATLL